MNNVTKIACAAVLIGLVSTYGILLGKSNSNPLDETEQYAVLTYYPYLGAPYKVENERYSVRIFYSGNKIENIKFIKKEELEQGTISNQVAAILSRLSNEGYSLVSTISTNSTNIDTEVHCFLKKVK